MSEIILESLFSSERVHGKYGYCQSDHINFARYPYVTPDFRILSPDEITNVKSTLSELFFGINDLGPFETSVLSYIYPINHHTINAIIGTRGCGKTALSKFLYDFLRSNVKDNTPFKRPLILYVDTNNVPGEPYQASETLQIIADEILNELTTNYWDEVRSFIDNYGFTGKKHKLSIVKRFFRLFKKNNFDLDVNDRFWETWDEFSKNVPPQSALGFALNLIVEIKLVSKTDFIYCCIDNIDPFSPSVQNDIIQELLRVVNRSRVPILIPVRLITARHNNIQQFQSKVIPHSGISPKKEIKRRVFYVINDIFKKEASIYSFPHLSDKEKAAFVLRTSEIFKCLNNNIEFIELFYSIVGYSVERGMSFINRCYNAGNIFIDYSETMNDDDTAEVKKLLSGNHNLEKKLTRLLPLIKRIYSRNNKELPKPYHVLQAVMEKSFTTTPDFGIILENIYNDPSVSEKKISSIKYRIISYLSEIEKTRKTPVKIQDIILLCKHYFFDDEMICQAINQLHDPNKRLIFNTGKNQYKSFEQLHENRFEDIGISFIGNKYLSVLSNSLDYIGFVLSKTESDYNNLFSNNLTYRITFLMRLIYEALYEELEYDDFVKSNTNSRKCVYSVLAHQWSGVLRHCINILKNHKTNINKSKRMTSEFVVSINNVFALHDGYLKKFSVLNNKNQHTLRPPKKIQVLDYSLLFDNGEEK